MWRGVISKNQERHITPTGLLLQLSQISLNASRCEYLPGTGEGAALHESEIVVMWQQEGGRASDSGIFRCYAWITLLSYPLDELAMS